MTTVDGDVAEMLWLTTYSIDGAAKLMLAYIHSDDQYEALLMSQRRRQAPAYLPRGKLELPAPPHWSSMCTHQSSETIFAAVNVFDGSS
jgi:hypothetical protein